MKIETMVINGKPIAQKRHRSARTASGIRSYDPSVQDKKNVQLQLLKHKHSMKGEVCLFVSMVFYFEPPKSWSKTKRKEAFGKPVTVKPDIDNLIKFYLDAMNGFIYDDDNRVCGIHAVKYYGYKARTEIKITEI